MRFPVPGTMRSSFGTAKRLFIAFALLVSTFAVASYLIILGDGSLPAVPPGRL
ncbi:MAG TPA: hypothetical protein VIV57_08495 [Anaeromyxobacter sp.]